MYTYIYIYVYVNQYRIYIYIHVNTHLDTYILLICNYICVYIHVLYTQSWVFEMLNLDTCLTPEGKRLLTLNKSWTGSNHNLETPRPARGLSFDYVRITKNKSNYKSNNQRISQINEIIIQIPQNKNQNNHNENQTIQKGIQNASHTHQHRGAGRRSRPTLPYWYIFGVCCMHFEYVDDMFFNYVI